MVAASLPSWARRTDRAWSTRTCDWRTAHTIAPTAITNAIKLPNNAVSSCLLPVSQRLGRNLIGLRDGQIDQIIGDRGGQRLPAGRVDGQAARHPPDHRPAVINAFSVATRSLPGFARGDVRILFLDMRAAGAVAMFASWAW